ncbi:MAG TPA: cellulase family glycosylhydrolase [Planctomycetota bacterium]|nr:cellulase family glycosylhydrolase [Planctomycetota bacterium]HRR79014.1 cellulase family glycosylhydrolase [Planctomycetota bacterium]HRT93845.1 cellulase family glycosylhydrolase [Planctomycetota bacterium]
MPHRTVGGWLAALLAAAGCTTLPSLPLLTPPRGAGLDVARDGTLRKDGKPFRGIGVNYFDLFYRSLRDPSASLRAGPADAGCHEGLAELARRGIPFARFMACGFWPNDWKLYFEDKPAYFALLDNMVKAAEEHGIGLIPSLFWASATVPDLVGEPRDAWGNPDSKTHAFMRAYTREIVTRYRHSPAIWGWEFGNEYNLDADLPNAAQHRPAVVPKLGTPAARSARDDLTHDALATALAAFADEVRKHDPRRIITSGHSAPRPSAWHQRKEKSWSQDDESQFAERLLLDHPDPVNVLSIHVYETSGKRFGREVSAAEFLALAMQVAAQAKKPLFVGEFGASDQAPDGEKGAKERLAALLAAIEKAEVPLAALWVYDFRGQDKDWNVTATNARAWQLDAIAEANQRIKARLLARPAEAGKE